MTLLHIAEITGVTWSGLPMAAVQACFQGCLLQARAEGRRLANDSCAAAATCCDLYQRAGISTWRAILKFCAPICDSVVLRLDICCYRAVLVPGSGCALAPSRSACPAIPPHTLPPQA